MIVELVLEHERPFFDYVQELGGGTLGNSDGGDNGSISNVVKVCCPNVGQQGRGGLCGATSAAFVLVIVIVVKKHHHYTHDAVFQDTLVRKNEETVCAVVGQRLLLQEDDCVPL